MQQFNLYKVLQMMLPFRKRKSRFIAWIKVFTAYLVMVMNDLFQYREKTIKDAKMTPQVCYLEKFLNSRYGVSTIKIVEGYELGPWCFYDGPPVGEIDMFMVEPDNYCYSNNVVTSVDFVVEVPRALEDQCSMIAAYVQKYKLAGKSFIIQLI